MKQSNFLDLNTRDLLRGLVMAILTPALVTIEQALDSGVFQLNWKTILISSIAGGIAYLLKNLATRPDKPILFSDGDGAGVPNKGI